MAEKIHYIKYLKRNRKELRSSLTPAKANLWSLLINSQLEDRKFRRQQTTPNPSLTKEGSFLLRRIYPLEIRKNQD
ncbi:MAG: DUF559 domain-containing protein [Nitrospirae bacterium]|nr:DUF559 domain-containing protein [Nitrospirota bacterium]